MICYQTNDGGVFIGLGYAGRDPLEPDRLVLPGGCVAEPPPSHDPGQQARWSGEGWVIEDSPDVILTVPDENNNRDGVLVGWDDKIHSRIIQLVPKPDVVQGKQLADWNGKEWVVTDIPEPEIPKAPMLTPAEKLASIGLTVDDLRKLLG